MKPIKITKNFHHDGKNYFAGDELKTKDMKLVSKLNELGYIEPLTLKEMTKMSEEIKEVKNGTTL